MPTSIAKLEKSLAGCWRLPPLPDADSCVTLLPNKTLEWTVTPASAGRTAWSIVTGEKRTGTWAVREKRSTQALDQIRKMMRGSSASLTDSSLKLVPKSLKRFANYDPESGTYNIPSGARSGQSAGRPNTVAHTPALAWLVLKVTNFPQSLINLTIMGTKVDTVDWVHNLKEIFSDHSHAILTYDGDTLKLRLPGGKTQTWERVSRFFPDMQDED